MFQLVLIRILVRARHLGHELKEDLTFGGAQAFEHVTSHGKLAVEERLIQPLAFFTQIYLNNSAIFIHPAAIHQLFGHEFVDDVGSRAERCVQDPSQVAHGGGTGATEDNHSPGLLSRNFNFGSGSDGALDHQAMGEKIEIGDELPKLAFQRLLVFKVGEHAAGGNQLLRFCNASIIETNGAVCQAINDRV